MTTHAPPFSAVTGAIAPPLGYAPQEGTAGTGHIPGVASLIDPRQQPQYVQSFQSPAPAPGAVRSFGAQGYGPFGYAPGYYPQLVTPRTLTDKQPAYHLKVTATPIEVPSMGFTPGLAQGPPEAPEYTVTAFPSMQMTREEAHVGPGGSVVAHAVCNKTIQPPSSARGFTIRPLGISHSQVPSSTGAPPTATGAPPVTGLHREHAMPRPLDAKPGAVAEDGVEDTPQQHPRIYNWIIPTGVSAAEPPAPTGFEEQALKAAEHELSAQERAAQDDAGALFTQASANIHAAAARQGLEGPEFAGGEEQGSARAGVSVGTTRILPSATDEELGLPNELRPSVVYGGIEHAPPEFAGTKGPLDYKLHAIEVHQYIPLPSKDDPWIIRNRLDPSTTAVFGPMPLPFDPAHSGMVAPTFQRTIDDSPAPALCPEVARMFNHELPVVSHVLQDVAEAEAAQQATARSVAETSVA